jgi:hypothetical protein
MLLINLIMIYGPYKKSNYHQVQNGFFFFWNDKMIIILLC